MNTLSSSPRITPFLWYDGNAEEAVEFYLTVFPNSRRLDQMRSGAGPDAKVMTVSFELDGQRFTALNGGPHFKFNEAVSFVVRCDSQAEIDDFWSKLTAGGGSEVQCGWLKDRFGLSWQIVPANIADLVRNKKGMDAMMGMKKLDIAELERAGRS